MEMTTSEIAEFVGGDVDGDGTARIGRAASPAGAGPDAITFAEDAKTFQAAVASAAGAILARRGAPAAPGKTLIRVERPRLAFVRIAGRLHPPPRPAPGVHATAVVHEAARVSPDAHVGPRAVVEAGAVIGAGSSIGPGAVIGEGSRIGEDCRLFANVVVYPRTTIGDRVIVHAGAILGSDGFGYVDVPEGKEKFPQLGTLVIHDDVEIGANTTIDRGALDATVIGRGTKIDNLVQIAHNVVIGEWTAISAQTGIAGTTRVGDRVTFGGQCGIADHATIGDRVMLGGGSWVISGGVLPGGAIYWGAPARPVREAKRNAVLVAGLDRLRQRIRALEKRCREDDR